MKANTRRAHRVEISAQRLDRYLNDKLHRVPGFEGVTVYAGYRLRAPDADGCNWSGELVPVHGARAPSPALIAATLRPIVEEARTRFNMRE